MIKEMDVMLILLIMLVLTHTHFCLPSVDF